MYSEEDRSAGTITLTFKSICEEVFKTFDSTCEEVLDVD